MKIIITVLCSFFVSCAVLAIDESLNSSPQEVINQLEEFKAKFNAVELKLAGLKLLVGPGKIALIHDENTITEMSSEEEKIFIKRLYKFILELDETVKEAEEKYQELKKTYGLYKKYRKDCLEKEAQKAQEAAQETPHIIEEEPVIAQVQEQPAAQNNPRVQFQHWKDTLFFCRYQEGVVYYDSATNQQWFVPYQNQ